MKNRRQIMLYKVLFLKQLFLCEYDIVFKKNISAQFNKMPDQYPYIVIFLTGFSFRFFLSKQNAKTAKQSRALKQKKTSAKFFPKAVHKLFAKTINFVHKLHFKKKKILKSVMLKNHKLLYSRKKNIEVFDFQKTINF